MFSSGNRKSHHNLTVAITIKIIIASILTTTPTVQSFRLVAAFGGRGGGSCGRRLHQSKPLLQGSSFFNSKQQVDASFARFRHPTPPLRQDHRNRHQDSVVSRRMTTSSSGTDTGDDDTKKNTKKLYLFDFDGVVCDSCDECTVSALRTLKSLRVIDDDAPDYPPDWLFSKMREIRPAIEVGWQIPVLLSVFWEQHQKQLKDATVKVMSVDEIIKNYESLVDEWLSKNKLTESDMIDTFGTIRDEWIQNDLQSWLDINTFYDGVSNSINTCCNGKSVLVTTKQQRFAIALCRHAGITETSLPDNLIYGLGQYKNKADVIVDQMNEDGGYDATNTYFFEDRYPTLLKCLKDTRLQDVKLHLCSWGYVTKEELELAHAEPRVTVLTLQEFANLVSSSES